MNTGGNKFKGENKMSKLIYVINGNLATDEDMARFEKDVEEKIKMRKLWQLEPTMKVLITGMKGNVVFVETIGG